MRTSFSEKKQSLIPASADAIQMQHNGDYNQLRPSANYDHSETQAGCIRHMPPTLQLKSSAVHTGEDTHTQNMFNDGTGNVKFDAETIENEFLHAQFQGAGNITLKAALLKLYELQSIGDGTQLPSHHPVMMAIFRVSGLRGLSYEKAKYQYIKSLKIRQEAEVNLAVKGKGPVDNLNIQQHPDYAGSTEQLRFGKIVGDVFGLDPAIATIISPTGGIVGPGNSVSTNTIMQGYLKTTNSINEFFAPLSPSSAIFNLAFEKLDLGNTELPDSVGNKNFHHAFNPHGAVSIHGAMHDAAGFLYNAFDIGPGYDYLGKEIGSNPGNPMTGQSNIEAVQDMMSRQGLSNGQGTEELMEQVARKGSNTYRSLQYGMTGDTNLRNSLNNTEATEVQQMDHATLIKKLDRLLSGWISDADVDAIEKLAKMMKPEQRKAVNGWFKNKRLTMTSIGQRLRVEYALSR